MSKLLSKSLGIITLISTFFFFTPVYAAGIAFDASSSGDGSGTSLTFSHTTSGSDRFLAVGARCSSSAVSVSSVTYNGVSMTPINNFSVDANDRTALYILYNPALGANNVVITCSSSVGGVNGRAVSYTGVTNTTLDNSGIAGPSSGTSISLTITATSSSAWIVGVMRNNQGDFTMTSGTNRNANGALSMADSNATCSSCTLAGTYASGSAGIIAVTIAPTATASAVPDIIGLVRSWIF